MKKNTIMRFTFSAMLILCLAGMASYGQSGSEPNLTSSYFHNGFSGTEINNGDQTIAQIAAGVTASQADDVLSLSLNQVESYTTLFVETVATPIDITTNSVLTVKMQTKDLALSETDGGPAVSLIWYLTDVNGNTAKKDAWQRDMWIGPGSSDMKEYNVDMTQEKDNCDLTKIVGIALHNQSHNGDWSKNKISGTILIDDMKIGKFVPVTENLTWSFFHNPFSGTQINNADQSIAQMAAGVTAAQANDTISFSLNAVESYTTLFVETMATPVDITANPTLTVKMQTKNIALSEIDASPKVSLIWYLTDVNGNTAKKDAWQRDMWIGAGSTDMKDYNVDMTQEKDNCDLTKIVGIALHNQSHNSDWSKNKISGRIIIDDLKIGKVSKVITKVSATSFANSFTENNALVDENQTTTSGASVTLSQIGGKLNAELTSVAANANILTVDLVSPLNFVLAKNPVFKLTATSALTEGSLVNIYFMDADGKKSAIKEVDLSTNAAINFAIEAGEANFSAIKKIVIENGSAVFSGTISMDDMFAGSLDVKVVVDPRTLEIAAKLGKSAVIDGVAEAGIWNDIAPTKLDRFVFWDNAYSADPTADNISGFFKTYYTADSLYFYIDVTDNSNSPVPDGSGTPWMYDGVEIYVNPDLSNDQSTGSYNGDAIQISLKRKTTGYKAKDQNGTVKYSYAIQEKTANGYSAELAISLADLKIPVNAEYTFGGEVSATDADLGVNDGNRTRKAIWNMDLHNDIAYNNTNSFGTFKLAAVPLVSVLQSTLTVASKIVTINLSPAIPGLTVSNFEISKSGANLTLKSATTTDNGATYMIESRNAFTDGGDYDLTATMVGYDINKITFKYSTVGVSENEMAVARIYPNPVSDKLFVEGNDLKTIEIISISGSLVKTMNTSGMKAVMYVAALNSGIYFIKTTNQQGKTQIEKFVKK